MYIFSQNQVKNDDTGLPTSALDWSRAVAGSVVKKYGRFNEI
jgi:hypothetical protein